MKVLLLLFLVLPFCIGVKISKCTNGNKILVWGITPQGKKSVVEEHNKCRQNVLDGNVPGQPRGKNINKLLFDDVLADKAEVVSKSCKMEHNIATDGRWKHVGQNIYISWSSDSLCKENWREAVDSWYQEHPTFRYPYRTAGNGHYTQLIWHETTKVGCHFVCFYDASKPKHPYTSLYTCNYGPAGNLDGHAPYELY